MGHIFRVNNKPFFSIGGQLHNSTDYCERDMGKALAALKLIGANTVAAPIMWETLEPHEDCFDYSQIELLIRLAREQGLQLVVLWFGSWKNGMSHYLPHWVKQDKKRFAFVQTSQGETIRNLSAICLNGLAADKKAFCKLMEHIKSLDSDTGTVLAVQVENEAGIVGCARDYSTAAQQVFEQSVPAELLQQLPHSSQAYQDWQSNGALIDQCWSKTFGIYSDEYFTAFYTAKYIEEIASSGQKIYNIPLYTNVWLQDMYWGIPGASYPSGGAVVRTLDIWKLTTPSLFTIAPDIYVGSMEQYRKVCGSYSRTDNLLYIPESLPAHGNAYSMFRAVAEYGAIGFHCFAVDTLVDAAGNPNRAVCGDFIDSMRCLSNAVPLLENRKGQLVAVVQEEYSSCMQVDFGDYIGLVKFYKPEISSPGIDPTIGGLDTFHSMVEPATAANLATRGCGLINYRGNGEFYLVGAGYRLLLVPRQALAMMTSNVAANEWMIVRHWQYLTVEEGRLDSEMQWHRTRIRNGDETDCGAWVTADVGLVRIQMDCD